MGREGTGQQELPGLSLYNLKLLWLLNSLRGQNMALALEYKGRNKKTWRELMSWS
jgi:hypothetical protein